MPLSVYLLILSAENNTWVISSLVLAALKHSGSYERLISSEERYRPIRKYKKLIQFEKSNGENC
jgi:hypothetical protein